MNSFLEKYRKFLRILRTIYYLRFSQLTSRALFPFKKVHVKEQPHPSFRETVHGTAFDVFLQPRTVDGLSFTFLGQKGRVDVDSKSMESYSKLWRYNLHYQDDLNARGAENRFELCADMVEGWIARNPPIKGDGWEPYCLSLRIVNWVKWFSRLDKGQIKSEWVRSLAIQASALDQQVEYHILGNHLFANAKALVFVGAFLGGERGDQYLKRGLRILDEQIREQFLDDGAHFELSPMYHASLMWDLGDLIALEQACGLADLTSRVDSWSSRFESGLEWLENMIHPDGDISFFNDTAIGIAPTLADLKGYGKKVGISLTGSPSTNRHQSRWLRSSGYVAMDWPGNHRLIADVAFVGPDYQPGHAHADTLSFELSLFGHRVLVNSGISQYGDDSERHRQRSTAAHNTVEVDGENSSEVWAGFRVARRAKPFDIQLEERSGQSILAASHDGYRRLRGNVVHRRTWRTDDASLEVDDQLFGRFDRAVAYWHFHPDVNVQSLGRSRFKLGLPQGQIVTLEVFGAECRLVGGSWHPRFGVSVANRKLELEFSGENVTTRIDWSSS